MSSSVLTPLIASPSDLRRARRELEALDEFLHQSGLRTGGKGVKLPTISRVLEELAADSDLNLLKKTDRERLGKFITLLIQKAPVLHMTFASEPNAKSMAKLMTWLRANIHPQLVVSIGIQPAIAAGCIVRTANRQFDFSLRESLAAQSESFITSLRQGLETPAPQPQPAAGASA